MENQVREIKITRDGGVLSVECPGCQRKHYGNALEKFLRSGELMPCRDAGTFSGCEVELRIIA